MGLDPISYSRASKALNNNSGTEEILSSLAQTKESLETKVDGITPGVSKEEFLSALESTRQSIESKIAQSEASHYQEKTATENGDVYPDEGYNALSKVTVQVAPGYTYKTTATGEIYEPPTVQAVSVFDGSFFLPTYTTTATGEIVAE